MQRSTFLRRTGGLALSAALALGACAQAAEPACLRQMPGSKT